MKLLARTCAGALLLASSLASVAAEANWDFHGITLGASERAVLEHYPQFRCRAAGPARRCEASLPLADHPGVLPRDAAPDVLLTFVDDRLVNLVLPWDPARFEATLDALKGTYGTPTEVAEHPFRTKGGPAVENISVQWRAGANNLRLDKYWRDATESRIVYSLD